MLDFDPSVDEEGATSSWRFLARSAHLALALLPALWLSGVLPPLEPLALWAAEQAQVFLFGGSASASTPRAAAQLALSLAQVGDSPIVESYHKVSPTYIFALQPSQYFL